MRFRFLIVIALSTLILVGCSPFVRAEQPTRSDFVTLSTRSSLGQTFFSRYHGLSGIDLYFLPNNPVQGKLTLSLKTDPYSEEDIAITELDLATIRSRGFYHFSFQPIWDSENRDFFLQLTSDQLEEIKVSTAPGDVYLHGALYVNKEPIDAQMTFRLVYNPYQAGLGIILLVISWLPILLAGLLIYCLPGWSVLKLLMPEWETLHWGEKFALSTSISSAFYPLLFLCSNLVGIHLGSLYTWLPICLGAIGLVWLNRKHLLQLKNFLNSRDKKIQLKTLHLSKKLSPQDGYLLVAFIAVFAVRFWAIRNLDIPLWGDSYQHTLIAQLLVDHKGLFNCWSPYAELQTFTYHFGFHSLVAVFYWLTKFSMPHATLWVGQILNGLAVISLYPIAYRITNKRWAGIFAVVIGGLLAPMPMYYLNWGRYTQLAGQVILTGVIYLTWHTLEKKRIDPKSIILNCILLSGLALTHYRVLIFALLFLLALFLTKIFSANRRILFTQVLLIGSGSGILFLPWFLHVFSGKILTILGKQLSTSPQSLSTWTEQYNAIGNLSTYLPTWLWLLLPFSMGWGLWRRNQGVALIALWWFFLVLAANPRWLGLPGEGTLQNFTVFIAAYIPASLIVGASVSWVMENVNLKPYFVNSQNQILLSLIAILAWLVFCGIALYGIRQRINDLQLNKSVLVTRPDLKASQWIVNNTPTHARFLVNSFFAYDDTLIVGADAGWWLPLLTGRQTTLPPINYGSERGPREDYRQWINSLTAEIVQKGLDDPDVLSMLVERNVTHVYIGQRQGRVNNPSHPLEPNKLLTNPHFTPIYHQDRVWVFQLNLH